jgi:hypothetical protein
MWYTLFMSAKALIDFKNPQSETESYPIAGSNQTALLSTRSKNDFNILNRQFIHIF